MQSPAFSIKHDEELIHEFEKWILVRKSLELKSFGINMVDIPAGGSIPEHTEVDRDQEEVFYVVSGTPTMVIDSIEYPLRQGSFVRVDPELKRTVINTSSSIARIMIASAPQTSGYQPMDWA